MMNKRNIGCFLLVLSAFVLFSCDKESTSNQTSDVAQLTSFYFADIEDMPGLAEAKFKIDERLDTGLVTNQISQYDSMRYGTSLKKVVPKFTFAASPGSATMHLGDTTIELSGTDTLDFTKTPIYLTIVSSDLSNTKVYEIKTTVHTVDPDLYEWKTVTSSAFTPEDEEQQVVMLGSTFYWFSNNGYANRLHTSTNAETWTAKTISGLPDVCHVKGILTHKDKLYYVDTTKLYISSDAENWTATDFSAKPFRMHTMIMSFNDTAWVLASDVAKTNYYLAQVVADTIRVTNIKLDNDFPVSGFSTVTFESSSARKRALIIGGYAISGKCTNSRWSLEYAPTIKGLYRLTNYSIEQSGFATLTGTSVIWYKNQLMMLGGVNGDMVFHGTDFYVSTNEGFTWTKIDTTKCKLPETYTPRQKQTVLINDNNIYIFGGEDMGTTYSDVYCGRLNSIDWPTE